MAKNDFLPFAIATGANVMSQDEYSKLPAVSTGFVSGLASSIQINKAIRQGTVMASILAQFIVDNTGNDVLDDGDTAPILALLNQAVGNISTAHIATATGSADEITATFSPAITLSNGMVVYVRATAANTTTAPTFNPDNLGALPIVKGANVALAADDIGGAGYWMILQYDQAFNKWVLQNPATGINIVIPSAMPVGAYVIQFSGMAAPADLYGGTWENISAQFAGQFFRAEGGNAAAFGQSQDCGAPNVYGDFTVCRSIDTLAWNLGQANGAFTMGSETSTVGLSNYSVATTGRPYAIFNLSSANTQYTKNEVRPYNSTIRIWKRTA